MSRMLPESPALLLKQTPELADKVSSDIMRSFLSCLKQGNLGKLQQSSNVQLLSWLIGMCLSREIMDF